MRATRALLLFPFLLPLIASAQLKYDVDVYGLPAEVSDAVTGDFDRDGRPDIAVSLNNGRLAMLRNAGSGAFTVRELNVAPGWFLSTADLNGDGRLDLVTPLGGLATSRALKTLLGRGDGSFSRGPDISLPASPRAAVPGDFNRDGNLDLAVLECTSTCQIALLLGNGDVTYRTTSIRGASTAAWSLASADFNQDGKLDLAVAVGFHSRAIIYYGDGTGGFYASHTISVIIPTDEGSSEVVPRLAVADFNGDGDMDLVLVVGTTCGSACGTSRARIYLNDGFGTFKFASEMAAAGTGGDEATPFDYNNDFKQDLLLWNGNHFGGGTRFLLGRGDGTFTSTTANFGTSDIAAYVPRDLNLDSRHDLIAASWMSQGLGVGLNINNTYNCAPPPSDTVRAKICRPGSTATTSFQVRAAGNSPAGIKRLELWVDGRKRYETHNDQLRFNLTLIAGTHRLVVVAVDKYIGTAKSIKYVTVQ